MAPEGSSREHQEAEESESASLQCPARCAKQATGRTKIGGTDHGKSEAGGSKGDAALKTGSEEPGLQARAR